MSPTTPTSTSLSTARVVAEFRERYRIQVGGNEIEAEISGQLRFSARSRLDFPAVGDQVEALIIDDTLAIIQRILPRRSSLIRKAAGRESDAQILAANVDTVFIVQAVDYDFNLNRLERYLTMAYTGGVRPVIIFNKIDLLSDAQLAEIHNQAQLRLPQIPLIFISALNECVRDRLHQHLKPAETCCFLGSSGAGKSTLINHLLGDDYFKTSTISTARQKGRHTTTHREMIRLPNGSILIDTPGLREVGVTDQTEGLNILYDPIITLAAQCRFADCTHAAEPGCAVQAAIEHGELDPALLKNYLKLLREAEHFEASVAEKHLKDRQFGRMCKEIMSHHKRNRS